MFKKVLSCILVILMVVMAVPFTVSASTTEPVVLEADGWTAISDAEDFTSIATATAPGNYYLTNDIDFGGETYQYLLAEFAGFLDGRGFALKNFKLEATDGGVSVFGGLTNNSGTMASIKNLTIGEANAPIVATVTANTSDEIKAGFLASTVNASAVAVLVDNVTVYGEMTVTGDDAFVKAGGFFGVTNEVSVIDSTFVGSITASGNAYVGGFVGAIQYATFGESATLKGCTADADLSGKNVGGIAGIANISTYVNECNVDGGLVADANVGSIAGAISCNADDTSMLFAITNNTLNAGDGVGAYGYHDKADKPERIYIYNNEGAEDTEARNIGDFSGDFDANYGYVWLIDDANDFAKIGTTDAEKNYTYSVTGLYRLVGDDNGVIDMGTTPRTTAVINCSFGGVLDGDNVTLTNLSFACGNKKEVALFKQVAAGNTANGNNEADDTLIINLNVGSAASMVYATSEAAQYGIIAAHPQSNSYKYSLTLDNVDVYAQMIDTKKYSFTGGFFGHMNGANMYDCTMNGSITGEYGTGNREQYGGFFAFNSNPAIMHECNNYADIDIKITGIENGKAGDRAIFGGISGGTANPAIFNECNNFGDITNTTTVYNPGNANVAGISAGSWNYSSVQWGIFDCANFGALTATNGTAAGATFSHGGTFAISHFANFGTLAGATPNNVYGSVKPKTLNCIADTSAMVEMREGAGVRLSADTGIRFMADVSDKAVERLEAIYGDANISYGILIAPKDFVSKVDAFTHAELEAYSIPTNGFEEGEKAYVDVEADGYFKNEAGVVAGSLLTREGDTSLYNVEISGIAYVMIKDADGNVVKTFYASAAQTRTICNVAIAALDDLNGEETTGYTDKLEVGETYYDNGEKKTVGDSDNLYSCYTKAQRDTLNAIAANAN